MIKKMINNKHGCLDNVHVYFVAFSKKMYTPTLNVCPEELSALLLFNIFLTLYMIIFLCRGVLI